MTSSGKCEITQSYAGLWIRVLAFGFDYLIIALYLVVISAVSLTVQLAFPNIVPTLLNNPVSCQIYTFCIITLPVALYFVFFESSGRQATWGKRRKGLKVIGKNGERLTRARAIGRTILKFIPWELAHTCIWQVSYARQEPSPLIMAGFLLVWILIGANIVILWISPTHQTLYDWLAGTYVVKG
ncbi:MAG: RDD family protein [Planctomycetota bacterium]